MRMASLMEEVEWSQPINLNTKRGPRLLRKAPITQSFWSIYRGSPEEFKAAFREAGINMSKYREQWELAWWSDDQLKFRPIPELAEQLEPEVDLTDLPPLLHPEGLLEFQLTSVQLGVRSMQRFNRVLLGHATGVGKTYCALGIARELGKKVAVVCPLAIKTDWYRAAKMMGVEIYDAAGYEWTKTGKSKIGRWVDDKKKEFRFLLPDDCILIWDEVHRRKSPGESQNSYLLRDSVKQNVPSIALSGNILFLGLS